VLVTATASGPLKQWDISNGSEMTPLAGDPGDVRALATSPDGSLLAAGNAAGTIHVWNLGSNEPPRSFERGTVAGESPETLMALSFSGDGKYLAANDSVYLRIIPLDKPQDSFVLTGHRDLVTGIIRTPIGERSLMSVAQDGNLVTWTDAVLAGGKGETPDSSERRRQFALRMQSRDSRQLLSVAGSDDGRWVVTGGQKGQIQLWDARAGVLIGAEFPALATLDIDRIAMAPDGSYFVSSNGTNLLLWPGPDRWAELTCAKLSWNLNPEQWAEMSPHFDYVKQCPDLPIAPGKGEGE
jgi:WD40 repeat protein